MTLWDVPKSPELIEAETLRDGALAYLEKLKDQRKAIDNEMVIARNQVADAQQACRTAREKSKGQPLIEVLD